MAVMGRCRDSFYCFIYRSCFLFEIVSARDKIFEERASQGIQRGRISVLDKAHTAAVYRTDSFCAQELCQKGKF